MLVQPPSEVSLRLFLYFFVFAVALSIMTQGSAQKLVDPTAVSPEYREAAEKRRAEQIRQQDCAHKADAEKVLPRERTAFLVHCLETVAPK
jgi:hypothetical protein